MNKLYVAFRDDSNEPYAFTTDKDMIKEFKETRNKKFRYDVMNDIHEINRISRLYPSGQLRRRELLYKTKHNHTKVCLYVMTDYEYIKTRTGFRDVLIMKVFKYLNAHPAVFSNEYKRALLNLEYDILYEICHPEISQTTFKQLTIIPDDLINFVKSVEGTLSERKTK